MVKTFLFIFFVFGCQQGLFADEWLTSSFSYQPNHLASTHSLSMSSDIRHALNSIRIEADAERATKIRRWLVEIAAVPKGLHTLQAIVASGHTLTIKHTRVARLSAGRTIAPMTNDLINGVGADITIIFDAEIPDSGSHQVFDGTNQTIEFTAVQNLYHELAHAMHKMQGTWRYFASEKQAIEEENRFRLQQAAINGAAPRERFHQSGLLIEPLGPAPRNLSAVVKTVSIEQ